MSTNPGDRTCPPPSTTSSPSNGVMAGATAATRPSAPMRRSSSCGSPPRPSISRAPRTTVGVGAATDRASHTGPPSRLRARSPLALAGGEAALLVEAPLLRRARRSGGPPGRRDAERCRHLGLQALERQLSVAGLGPLGGHDHPHGRAEPVEQQRPLAGPRRGGRGDVPDELDPRVGRVGVLAARPPAAAEAPGQLVHRDAQPGGHDQFIRHERRRKSRLLPTMVAIGGPHGRSVATMSVATAVRPPAAPSGHRSRAARPTRPVPPGLPARQGPHVEATGAGSGPAGRAAGNLTQLVPPKGTHARQSRHDRRVPAAWYRYRVAGGADRAPATADHPSDAAPEGPQARPSHPTWVDEAHRSAEAPPCLPAWHRYRALPGAHRPPRHPGLTRG